MKPLLPAVAFLLISGCTAPPPFQAPELDLELPAKWEAAEAAPEPPAPRWWAAFGDPDLDRIEEEALTRNRDLAAAAERIAAAGAQATIAGADLYPQAIANGNSIRQRFNFIGFPIPGAPSGSVLTTKSTTFGISLQMSWEVDLWGRIRAGREAALADYQSLQADYAGARLSLAGRTAKAWFALTEARLQEELARSTLAIFQSTAEVVRARFEKGLAPSLDLRLALTNAEDARALLMGQRELRDRAARSLEVLLNRYPAGAVRGADRLPSPPEAIPGGLPVSLVTRRPDLVAAERRLAASGARVEEARAALLPDLTLSGLFGTSSTKLRDIFDKDLQIWNMAGNLTAPLFEGGRLRAGVSLAEARTREAVRLFGQAVFTALGEVESALAAEGFLVAREEALAASAEQAHAARRIARERYAKGLAGITTLLDAQRNELNASSQLLAVRRLRLENRVDLYLALGGGFERRQLEEEDPS